MNKSMIKVGFTFMAALGLVASMGQAAFAADVFDETAPIVRDCNEETVIDAILDDGKNLGAGAAIACDNVVDLVAEANPSILDLNEDFEFQVLLLSNDRIIRGISDNTVIDGPEQATEPDPGGNLELQVIVSVF